FIFNFGRKFYGGVVNTVNLKSFELSFLLQFVKQTSQKYSTDITGGRVNLPVYIHHDRWQQEGDVASIQMDSSGSAVFTGYSNHFYSDARLEDASFIRLKTLSFAYSLPDKLLEKVMMEACTFYLQGQNLLTLTDFKGIDPETGSNNIPPLKSITLGIQ